MIIKLNSSTPEKDWRNFPTRLDRSWFQTDLKIGHSEKNTVHLSSELFSPCMNPNLFTKLVRVLILIILIITPSVDVHYSLSSDNVFCAIIVTEIVSRQNIICHKELTM